MLLLFEFTQGSIRKAEKRKRSHSQVVCSHLTWCIKIHHSKKVHEILRCFCLSSRSGRSAKQRSESGLTHMFCVLDWHDVSRLIASLKNLKNLMLLLIEFTQRSIPKAEKQKQSHLYVLCSRNVNRQCQMRMHNMRVRAFSLLSLRIAAWTESKVS